jgi:hypothetical protein
MRSATFETGLTIIQLTNQRTKLHVITSAHAVKVYMTTKHLRRISHGHFYFILLHSYCDVFKICELILHCNVLWKIHVLVDFSENCAGQQSTFIGKKMKLNHSHLFAFKYMHDCMLHIYYKN